LPKVTSGAAAPVLGAFFATQSFAFARASSPALSWQIVTEDAAVAAARERVADESPGPRAWCSAVRSCFLLRMSKSSFVPLPEYFSDDELHDDFLGLLFAVDGFWPLEGWRT